MFRRKQATSNKSTSKIKLFHNANPTHLVYGKAKETYMKWKGGYKDCSDAVGSVSKLAKQSRDASSETALMSGPTPRNYGTMMD